MLIRLLYCFIFYFVGYSFLRILPLPGSYIQTLVSFFSLLAALAAIYIVLCHALTEQIEKAGERRDKEKTKSLSWAVYPSLFDFTKVLDTFETEDGLFLYDKACKAQELLRDKFTDTAKNWFLDDLLSYYEYIAERASLADYTRMSENLAQLEYIDKEQRLDILRELSKLAKLRKEYDFLRQTTAAGKMSAQYYKSYEINKDYDKSELKQLVREITEQIEEHLDIGKVDSVQSEQQ